MTLPRIVIDGTVTDNIRLDLSLGNPLVRGLVEQLVAKIRARVHGQGRDASGRPWANGRDMNETGQLARSIVVQLRGADEILVEYASTLRSDGERNADVAERIFAGQRLPALQPSEAELQWFASELAARMPQLIGETGEGPPRIGNGKTFVTPGVGI